MIMSGNFLGVVIIGGQSRRFNHDIQDKTGHRDKFLMSFGSTTLLGHIITRAKQQIPTLILNVNGDQNRVACYGLDVVADDCPDAGPLGGIVAAMNEAIKRGYRYIVTFSGDSPFFPEDYVARLVEVGQNNMIAVARSRGKTHPVMGCFPVSLQDDLVEYLNNGQRRVMVWIQRHCYKEVVWNDKTPDPFFNINHPGDLKQAMQHLKHV